MELIDALETVNLPAAAGARALRLFLGCGFTPLHLKTFVAAHLRALDAARPVQIETGRFGDLTGNLERLDTSTVDAVVVVVEWADLDSRLGMRELGGWRASQLADVLESCGRMASRLERAIAHAARSVPAVCVMPTLALPPMFPEPRGQSGAWELQIHALRAALASSVAKTPGVVVVSQSELDRRSPPAQRLDIAATIATGFPYTLSHASTLGQLIAGLAGLRQPKKGLITDLDDTLWSGIVGEIGSANVAWSLSDRQLAHGLYQQTLASLAGAGVLLAVASKNEPAIVAETFARPDMLLSKDEVFPFEVSWGRKSESVGRILEAWNIGADAVVFVDDNAMEVAEVKAAFPAMECRIYPKSDAAAVWQLLGDLRDMFGKRTLSEEDGLRAESIRRSAEARRAQHDSGFSEDDFLQGADARVVFDGRQPDTRRAFELLNKTNQFNLNGRRLDEAAWSRYLERDQAFLLTVGYEDKYARLGQIAVLLGRRTEDGVVVDHWAMSCRAFSRRIEHQCMRFLFDKFGAPAIGFEYDATPRNQPLQEFLRQMLAQEPAGQPSLSRDAFLTRSPALFHRVEDRT